jgi:hypothetical protein
LRGADHALKLCSTGDAGGQRRLFVHARILPARRFVEDTKGGSAAACVLSLALTWQSTTPAGMSRGYVEPAAKR